MVTATATRPRASAARTAKPAARKAAPKAQPKRVGISKASAAVLWDDLRVGLLDVESSIRKIIETRAWVPLGYSSFAQAWAAETKGIAIAGALRAEVVYTMIDDGSSNLEIGEAVGSSPDVVAGAREKKAEGAPPTGGVLRRRLPASDPDKHYVPGYERTSRSATDDVPITFRITKLERKAWSEFVPDLAAKAEELLRDYCEKVVSGHAVR